MLAVSRLVLCVSMCVCVCVCLFSFLLCTADSEERAQEFGFTLIRIQNGMEWQVQARVILCCCRVEATDVNLSQCCSHLLDSRDTFLRIDQGSLINFDLLQ